MSKQISITALLAFIPALLFAQFSFTSTGGDVSGSGGSASFSVGQVADGSANGVNFSIFEGVQQPYEIFNTSVTENEFLDMHILVFPNPTTDNVELSIENNNGQEFVCILFDLEGKILIRKSFTGNASTIETNSLPPGTYILKVLSENKEIQSFKVIKN